MIREREGQGNIYEALAEFLPKSRLQTLWITQSDYDTWSPQNQAAAEPGRRALLGALNQTHLKLLELGLNEEERRAGWGNESNLNSTNIRGEPVMIW